MTAIDTNVILRYLLNDIQIVSPIADEVDFDNSDVIKTALENYSNLRDYVLSLLMSG